MYKRELENLIRQKALPKSVLLYGACDYQITTLGEQITQVWSGGHEEPLTFYFDAYDYASAKSHISQSSLFGDKNILIIKTDKNIPKKELDVLISLCQKDANSFLLVQCYNEENAKNLTKSFTKNMQADFVRFFKPNIGEAMQMMMQRAKEMQLNIQSYALQHLYMTHNEELSLAISEFTKLATLGREITRQDIDHLVYGLGTVAMDDFIAKLLSNQDIKHDYQSLIEEGSHDETRIVNAIENYVTQLFTFHAYIKLHGTFDAKAVLGYPLPPQLAKERASQSIRIEVATYQKILAILTEAELLLKTGTHHEKGSFLLSTLLKVQAQIKK